MHQECKEEVVKMLDKMLEHYLLHIEKESVYITRERVVIVSDAITTIRNAVKEL